MPKQKTTVTEEQRQRLDMPLESSAMVTLRMLGQALGARSLKFAGGIPGASSLDLSGSPEQLGFATRAALAGLQARRTSLQSSMGDVTNRLLERAGALGITRSSMTSGGLGRIGQEYLRQMSIGESEAQQQINAAMLDLPFRTATTRQGLSINALQAMMGAQVSPMLEFLQRQRLAGSEQVSRATRTEKQKGGQSFWESLGSIAGALGPGLIGLAMGGPPGAVAGATAGKAYQSRNYG